MLYELSQRFQFEAAHTLERDIDAEPSRRIHGHTYHAEVTLRGTPDPASGMLMDLGHFRRAIAEVQAQFAAALLSGRYALPRQAVIDRTAGPILRRRAFNPALYGLAVREEIARGARRVRHA